MTVAANCSAAAIHTVPASDVVPNELKGRPRVSGRFLVALGIIACHGLLGTSAEAGAQIQNSVPVQNGAVFNSQGSAPLTGPFHLAVSKDDPPNGTTAGAVETVVVDPLHPGTIYVGAVNGGIWKTTNDGMNWTPLIDQKASLSIASLAFDPTDPTRQTLIAGTGITSNGLYASISLVNTVETGGGLRNGLLYSRDGGTTWTRLGETILSGQSVVGVAALGSTMLAATFEPELASSDLSKRFTGGLYRSTDSGANFYKVSGAPGSGLPKGPVSSLVSDPGNPNVLYAAITAKDKRELGHNSVYVSTNAGATWQELFRHAARRREPTLMKVAAGPNGSLAIGLVNARSYQVLGLFYSNNAGANWRKLTTPPAFPSGNNFAIAIDPNNNNLVYVMGTNVAVANPNLYSALAIYRVNATTNSYSRMSDDNGGKGNTGNRSYVHPDGRAFAFDVHGNLLTTTDTGLYVRTNPRSATAVWKNMLGDLSTSELYALAYDSNSKRLVLAMQDNTTAVQSEPGSSLYHPTGTAGDGLNAAVNDVTLGSNSVIYVSSQELFLWRLVVDQNGGIISPGGRAGVFVQLNTNTQFDFLSPFVLNNIDKRRIAIGSLTGVYLTRDTLTGSNAPGATTVNLSLTPIGNTNTNIVTIDYGTRNNENALLAGGGNYGDPNGVLYLSRSATPGSLMQLSAYTGLAPTSVKFDLRSDQRLFIADSVNLFGSLNQGTTFQTLTLRLPANFIRPTSLAFIDSNGVDALLVGGLNKVDNAGNPLVVADSNANGVLSDWRRFGSALPNTIVRALSYNPKSDTLAVGTVGRGAFLLYDVTSNFATAKVLQFGLADNDSNPDPAILFGDRPLIKYGTGTLTINALSTYTGGTFIENGTLVAGTLDAAQKTSFALGTGSVFVNGRILRAPSFDRLVINVGRNYAQGPGGTLALAVAGIIWPSASSAATLILGATFSQGTSMWIPGEAAFMVPISIKGST